MYWNCTEKLDVDHSFKREEWTNSDAKYSSYLLHQLLRKQTTIKVRHKQIWNGKAIYRVFVYQNTSNFDKKIEYTWSSQM